MLSFTRKTDYALVALATLADEDASRCQPLSANRIAQRYDLPPHVLIKVLKTLLRAGLVGSTRGAHGGYYLAKAPAWITLADVIEAIEGKAELTPCCCENGHEHTDDSCIACRVLPDCPIGDRMQQLNQRINAFFRQITLKDLLSADFKVGLTEVTVEGQNHHAGAAVAAAAAAG